MFKIHLIDMFLRGIPEATLFVWGIHLFSFKKIKMTPYLLSSLIYILSSPIIRMLPIDYGVHTALAMMVSIFTSNLINNIPLIKAISSTLILTILLSICEWFNILILANCFKINVKESFSVPLLKDLYGIPSLILFTCITLVFYIYLNKKKEALNDVLI